MVSGARCSWRDTPGGMRDVLRVIVLAVLRDCCGCGAGGGGCWNPAPGVATNEIPRWLSGAIGATARRNTSRCGVRGRPRRR